MTGAYVYDPAWEAERERLAGLEALWDAGTRAVLTAHGVAPGAAVLEVGAGGGSVVEWEAAQVGPSGRVLALDVDTRFLARLASEVVEVRTADVITDPLPEAAYDVVHARMLLEHLPERSAVVHRLAGALRPGGWLVVEDYDWTSFGFEAPDEIGERAAAAVLALMAHAGFDATYGRRITVDLRAAGLGEVGAEGRSLVIDASHPGYAFFALSFEQLAPQAVAAGLLSEADAGVMRERMADGAIRMFTPAQVAAFGRR
jgi:SAM-dependent methyltransferase